MCVLFRQVMLFEVGLFEVRLDECESVKKFSMSMMSITIIRTCGACRPL